MTRIGVFHDRTAAGQMDAVALVTGDAGLTPLVSRLRGCCGIQVLLPATGAEFADPLAGGIAQLHPGADLRVAAGDMVELDTLLRAALADGYPLRDPFTAPKAAGRG